MSKNYTDTRQKLAFIIRDQRKSAGWSQEEFAEKAQIDRTYVSQIERGVANPSLSVLCKIADVFEMQLTELLNDWLQCNQLFYVGTQIDNALSHLV